MTDGMGFEEFHEAFYDAALAAGTTPSVGIFNKRVLLPLAQLPALVEAETGQVLPPARLDEIVAESWIPQLALEENEGSGFALYAPSRVGLFLRLERRGYAPAELRAVAAYEEGYIDNILVDDETPYIDDDRDLLLNEWGVRLADTEMRLERIQQNRPLGDDTSDELDQVIEHLRRSLEFLERRELESMSPALREKTARLAYRVRFFHEMLRVQLLGQLRGQVEAGYSPFLSFHRASYAPSRPPTFEGVAWEGVLESPWVGEDGVPIRFPELLVQGDQITLLRPMRPTEYEESWVRHDLDRYFRLLARQRGERRCPQCHAVLPGTAHELRQYCSPECRANAKMQRYRDRLRHRTRPAFDWEEFD